MPRRLIGWSLFALFFTGLAWAQGVATETADSGEIRRVGLLLTWALVWILLAAGLSVVLFKLYSQWPGVERRLVVATLLAMPPVSTVLTTAHVPLVGWLADWYRDGRIYYAAIFVFWGVVALCFGAAWRMVKRRSTWLNSPQATLETMSSSGSPDPDSWATRVIDADPAPVPPRPTPQNKPVRSDSAADSRAELGDAPSRMDQAPARTSASRNQAAAEPAGSPEQKSQPTRAVTDSIFISYRRQDSADATGRIYDRLIQHFDRKQVFKDVDSIPLGVDFRTHLGDVVGRCDFLLAVIGPQWLTVAGPNGRRLDDVGDFVRVEIEAALARNIPVVPLLVGGAELPSERELPPSLAPITFRNGIAVRPDPDFHRDMDRLIAGLESQQRG